jgi:hypothetical protein
MGKILYLTADYVATSAERSEIATLREIAEAEYELVVMCGKPRAALTATTLSAAAADNSYNDSGATITASTISAASADNSINDSGNGFVTAGFQVGDSITVSGFTGNTANNATRIATSVAAGKIIFAGTDGDTIVNDSAGESVTASAPGRFLLRRFKVGDSVMVRGFTGNTANNINSGVVTSVTAAKMIIGGTDGDVIVNDAAGESVTISTVDTGAKYGTVAVVADYIAGTITEAYKSSGTPIYTQFDPANPPDPPSLIETQAVVTDGDTVAIGSDDVTLGVAANVLSASIPATKTILQNGDTVAVGSGTATLTVSGGALASAALDATHVVVATAQELAITSGSGTTKVTLTISGGAITAVVLS